MEPEQVTITIIVIVVAALVGLLIKALRSEALQRFLVLDRDIDRLRQELHDDKDETNEKIEGIRKRLHDLEGAPSKKDVVRMLEEMENQFQHREKVLAADMLLGMTQRKPLDIKMIAIEVARELKNKGNDK